MNKDKTERERQLKVFEDYLHSEDYQERLLSRLKLNDAAERKQEARQYLWLLCHRPDNPAEGCIFFIETFGWTFDPRMEPNHRPFILFEFQKRAIRELVNHINDGQDLLLEKSRDMGVTWIALWVFIWYWIFGDGINLLVGSYKEKLVDDRSDDSLFGRIDYALDNLPKWLLPKGFKKSKHRTQMKLVNPVNYNLISGDTMNPDFGRGSRKTAIFFDELGSWQYAKDAWEACGDVAACRIANSTPKGYNYYAKLRNSGMDVLTLHWKEHPLKDELWYEFEKTRRTEESVAQELDISYNKSQEGRVYPEWNEQNITLGIFEYDPNLPLYVGWDFGRTDDTAIVWVQPDGMGIRVVDTFAKGKGHTIDYFLPFVTGILPSDYHAYTKQELEIIDRHKYWNRGVHFGDPSGRFHNQVTNETVHSVLENHGIRINFKDQWKEFQKRKTAAKLLIRDGINLNKTPQTEYFHMCMAQASYPKVLVEGEEEIRSIKPLHNWTSHYRSAFEYLALGLSEYRGTRSTPYDKFPIRQRGKRAMSY